MAVESSWKLDLGAELVPNGVLFRVWAPKRRRLEVVLEQGSADPVPMTQDKDGYYSALVRSAGPGTLYRYRVEGDKSYPDPCSRFQPQGPHGPSMVVDPHAYHWKDHGWQGARPKGQVIYELHIGTLSAEGTFDAAIKELSALKELGITLLELMPVVECSGGRNWGYDGVDLFAPNHNYGDPQALKRFVDAAHGLGLGVLLDVVYNHLGPDGNYCGVYSEDYFTDRYKNDWGQAINFDGPGSKEVREFFIRNACYWIAEFHLDGFRVDATQNICDSSPKHVLTEMTERVRALGASKSLLLYAENEPQNVRCIQSTENGGFGLDGMWNDDFHHCARVAMTGRREAYYSDYLGSAQEFISLVKRGFLYQGQRYRWQKQPRGSDSRKVPAQALITYLQNHDQVANSLTGDRILVQTSAARYRAMAALMLLSPQTPLLFMGQEYGAKSPFLFFTDIPALSGAILQGRREFLAQFPSYGSPEAQEKVPDPCKLEAFIRSKLDKKERSAHQHWLRFHRDLLQLRQQDPVLSLHRTDLIDGAVLGPKALVLRYITETDEQERLLVVNWGDDLELAVAPEPLLAPPASQRWSLLWHSDAPLYGGPGIISPCNEQGCWRLPSASASLLGSVPAETETIHNECCVAHDQ